MDEEPRSTSPPFLLVKPSPVPGGFSYGSSPIVGQNARRLRRRCHHHRGKTERREALRLADLPRAGAADGRWAAVSPGGSERRFGATSAGCVMREQAGGKVWECSNVWYISDLGYWVWL